jgi:hypothetical protein
MADCTSPAGVEADMFYNTTHKRVQYCDGSNWVNMGVNSAVVVETDPKVGTLTNTKWCRTDGTQVICDQDAPSGAPSGTLCGSRRASCGTVTSSPTALSYSGDSVLCSGTTIAAGSCNTSRVPQTISCPSGYTGQKLHIQTRSYTVSFQEYITADWHLFCSKD